MPFIPFGNLGKFSTLVVAVSWPPRAMPLAIHPSKRMGFNSALDAYMAAVWAAMPLPLMHYFVLRVMLIEYLKGLKEITSTFMGKRKNDNDNGVPKGILK